MSRLQCRRQIQALWDEKWAVYAHDVPVLWHRNIRSLPVPDATEAPFWLHVAVDFGVENLVAFGSGRFHNGRRLYGALGVSVFSAVNEGEDFALQLLDDALAVFRSERRDALSFIGEIGSMDEGGSEDGVWYMRAARLLFEFRFTG